MTKSHAASLAFGLALTVGGQILAQETAPLPEPKQSAVQFPLPAAGRKVKTAARHARGPRDRSAKTRPVRDEGAAFHALIARHAGAHGIPVPLGEAVVRIESRYNARIIHAGNYGLMQIRLQTARGVGYAGPPAGLLDPETNLHFGMKYLAIGYREAKGDTCLALMRYQSGTAAQHLSAANKIYCAKALRLIANT